MQNQCDFSRRLRFRAFSTCALLMGLVGVVGCATPVSVVRIGTDGTAPAWQLRGPDVTQLRLVSQQLCPKGYTVLQRFEKASVAADADSISSQVAFKVAVAVGAEASPDSRLTIVCNAFVDPEPTLPEPERAKAPETIGG
jgi:hypothetical protein